MFGVVIVNWNAGSLLRKCVESLLACQARQEINEIVVVDNASSDDSLEQLSALQGNIVIVESDSNLGFGAACNLGVERCQSDWIAFVNPDACVEESPFPRIAQETQNREIGVIGIKLLSEDGTVQRGCARRPNLLAIMLRGWGVSRYLPKWIPGVTMNYWDHADNRDVDHVIGAFYCISKDLFTSVGGFDRRFFVYYEDLDLSVRVKKRGFRVRYLADAWAHHIGGGVSEQIKAKRLFLSLNARTHYAHKHFGIVAAIVLLASMSSVELAMRLVKGLIKGGFGDVVRAYTMLAQSVPNIFQGQPAS